MKKVRVAIVGYGRSGRDIHTRSVKNNPDKFELKYIVDANPAMHALILEETGLTALSDHLELIPLKAEIDLVINASFSMEHQQVSLDLLRAGLTVMSEKPAASSAEGFEAMMAAAQETGARLLVFQQYRYTPAFETIQQVIASGVLGRLVHIKFNTIGFGRRWDWQTRTDFQGGSLYNKGPHPLDQVLLLMGFPKDVAVTCLMDHSNTAGDADDYVKLLLAAPGKPIGEIELSSTNAFDKDAYLVEGKLGTLHGTDRRLEWRFCKEEELAERQALDTILLDEAGKPAYCRENVTYYTETWEPNAGGKPEFEVKTQKYYEMLYDALANGAPFLVKPEEVLLQMRVMDEAHEQSRLWRDKMPKG